MRARVRHVERLQRLVVFDAAARLGSFTAAASELEMSQPAVTRQVLALEPGAAGPNCSPAPPTETSSPTPAGACGVMFAAGFDTIEGGLAGRGPGATRPCSPRVPASPSSGSCHASTDSREALGERELRLRLFDRDDELAHGEHDASIRVGDGTFPGQSSRMLFPEVVVPVAARRSRSPTTSRQPATREGAAARAARAHGRR